MGGVGISERRCSSCSDAALLPTSIHIAGVAVGCMGCRSSRGGSESCIQSVCFSLLRDSEPSCCRVYPVQCTYSVAAVPTLLSTPITAPPLRRPAACVAKPRTDLHACRGPRMNKCSKRRPDGFASTSCHACCRRGLVCMSAWTVHKQEPNVQTPSRASLSRDCEVDC